MLIPTISPPGESADRVPLSRPTLGASYRKCLGSRGPRALQNAEGRWREAPSWRYSRYRCLKRRHQSIFRFDVYFPLGNCHLQVATVASDDKSGGQMTAAADRPADFLSHSFLNAVRRLGWIVRLLMSRCLRVFSSCRRRRVPPVWSSVCRR